jgi:hypothetical protein
MSPADCTAEQNFGRKEQDVKQSSLFELNPISDTAGACGGLS